MNVSGIYESYVENRRIGMQPEEANLYVIRALRHVIQDVFSQISATLVITLATRSWQTGQWFDFVLGDLGSAWSSVAVQLLRINRTAHVPGRKYCNLLLIDSFEGLLLTDIAKDNAQYDDPEYYFIFLQARDAELQHELQLILNHCLYNYWLHCNVMVQTAQNDVLVYSYYPYTVYNCHAAQPKLVNRYDGHRMLNAPMFPNKLRQLHQCPISALLWHTPPFVELSWDAATSEIRAKGFEVTLIEHLAQHLNFSLVLQNLTLQHLDKYQLSKANGTLEGPLEILMQQRVNLGIGNFRKTARRNLLLSSPQAHYYAPLVATLGTQHFLFSRLELLLYPFELSVWCMLLAALILHGGIYMFRWRGTGLQVVELLLGATVARLPRSWLQRIIYAHWLYGSIPLRIVYQSLLFHFIRLQLLETLPSSFEQLLADNFRGLSTPNTLAMMNEVPQVSRNLERFMSIASSYDQDVLNTLHQANGRSRFFAITDRDVTSAYLRATNRYDSYLMLPQYVYVQQVGIYMPKHSYFYEQFNLVLRQLDAGGLIDFWRRSAFEKYSHTRICTEEDEQADEQLQDQQIDQNRATQLNDGIYSLIGVLYVLACLVFCAELLVHRCVNQANSTT